MGNLNEIKERHGRDGWKDVIFIGVAVLLTAISIGSVTSKAAGSTTQHEWGVSMVEDPGQLR
jgi:hypothetical protein